jgi:methyltransferase (TIGR00027 family)
VTELRAIDGAPPVARTAFWTAYCRAEESRRDRPLVVDPLAERLCGPEGMAIGREMEEQGRAHASVVVRTRVIDERLASALTVHGAREVVVLGAGLDARAYRLHAPAGVRFVEGDFEEILAWKTTRLAGVAPPEGVAIERHAVELRAPGDVARLLASLGRAPRVVVLEGVLAYLSGDEVEGLLGALRDAQGPTRVIADVGGGLWSTLFAGRVRSVVGRAGAPYRTQIGDARRFFERRGFRVEADVSLVAWDRARSERRFASPWTRRLAAGLDDVARVLEVVPDVS